MKYFTVFCFLLLSFSLSASEVKLLRFDLCEILTLNCPAGSTEVTDQLDRCGCLYDSEMVALKNCPTTPVSCQSGKWSWLSTKLAPHLIGCGCYDTYYPDEN